MKNGYQIKVDLFGMDKGPETRYTIKKNRW